MKAISSIASISISGMNAAQVQLNTSAGHIANSLTPGFKRQDVALQPDSSRGMSVTTVAAADQQQSIETDVVQQLQAKNAFLANLTVFRTSNQMMGSLLNLQA